MSPIQRRRYLVALLAVSACALLAVPAQAHTTIIEPPGSPYPFQRWANEASVPTPDVTLTVELNISECTAGDTACTNESSMIWMQPGIPMWVAHSAFLHELGHNFDADLLPEWGRQRFRVITGHLTGPWTDPGVADTFAEAYRRCAGDFPPEESILNGLWRTAKLAAVCRLIDRLGPLNDEGEALVRQHRR